MTTVLPQLPNLIILVGIPGSGKSTKAKELVSQGYTHISADRVRAHLYGNANCQGDSDHVFRVFNDQLNKALLASKNVVVDNTNCKQKYRDRLRYVGNFYNYAIETWVIDTPLDECIRRNGLRSRVVPEHILTNMYKSLHSNFPSSKEGVVKVIKSQVLNEVS